MEPRVTKTNGLDRKWATKKLALTIFDFLDFYQRHEISSVRDTHHVMDSNTEGMEARVMPCHHHCESTIHP